MGKAGSAQGKRENKPLSALAPAQQHDGAAAVALWVGAVGLLALFVRAALDDDGHRLASAAPWLAAMALAGFIAWGVGRAAKRWFYEAAAALLLASVIAHVATWARDHAAKKAREARVTEAILAIDRTEPAALEALLDRIDRERRDVGRGLRDFAAVIVDTHRETRRRLEAYRVASAGLGEAILDVSKVASAEELDARIVALRAFARESRALLEHQRTTADAMNARFVALGVPANLRAAPIAEGGSATQDAYGKLAAQTRETEQRWADACVEHLKILSEGWGKWKIDPALGAFTFTDEALRARHAAAAIKVDRAHADTQLAAARIAALEVNVPTATVLEARAPFTTQLRADAKRTIPPFPAPAPPPRVLQRIRYRALLGELTAYVTPDPRDGKKHPAILWAHGGFEGIGDYVWAPAPSSNDQSARAFREAGIVTMYPSLRGENDNPGRFEMFYGELEDLLSARAHLARLPYVDADRIYLAGHSAGGTLVLLAAAAGVDFRAAFSFGGLADVTALAKMRADTPFDVTSAREIELRSPVSFAGAIARPTFLFEGATAADVGAVRRMEALAEKAKKPFALRLVDGGNHFDVLDPITRLVARKILEDTGSECSIAITDEEVQEAFAKRNAAPPPKP